MERSLDIDGEVLIRPLNKEDIPSILAVDSKVTGASRSSLDREKVAYQLRNPMVCWGAEAGGALVGFMLGDIRGWEFGVSESGWIEILGVDPAYQRKGVGRALLNAMLEELKKMGVKKALVIARWYDPILSFFRAEGFEHGELLSVQRDLDQMVDRGEPSEAVGGRSEGEGIEHIQLDPPKIFDAVTFLLQFGPLKPGHPDQETFREDVRTAIQNYLDRNGLHESVRLLAKDHQAVRLSPVSIFGAEFRPDLALEEGGKVVAAILVKLVKASPTGLAQAAGLALICSYHYPWVLCLVLDKGKRRRENRALDHEFRAYMWHHRGVRFLFR